MVIPWSSWVQSGLCGSEIPERLSVRRVFYGREGRTGQISGLWDVCFVIVG